MSRLKLLLLGGALASFACGGFDVPGVGTEKAAKKGGGKKNKKPAAAAKGMVEVVTAAAVSVSIDGSPIAYDMASGSYHARLSPGTHTLEVFNLLGERVASESFQVESGLNTKYRYRKGGRLESFGTLSMDDAPAEHTVSVAPVVVDEWEPAPAAFGSIELAGVPTDSRVWIDGAEIWSYDGWGNYTSTYQSTGWHDVRIEQYNTVLYSGSVEVRADQNRRCVYAWGVGLDCHFTTPAIY